MVPDTIIFSFPAGLNQGHKLNNLHNEAFALVSHYGVENDPNMSLACAACATLMKLPVHRQGLAGPE
jgi:hypothetical protein